MNIARKSVDSFLRFGFFILACGSTPALAFDRPVPVTVTNSKLPVTVGGNVSAVQRGDWHVTVTNPADSPAHIRNVDAGLFTHIGQKASKVVLLNFLAGCSCYKRVLPDGTLEGAAFSVPSSEIFVLTDVDWSISGGNPGQTASLLLLISNAVVMDSRTAFNGDGTGGKTEHFSGGRIFSSALPLPVYDRTPRSVLNNLVLTGYLAPNE